MNTNALDALQGIRIFCSPIYTNSVMRRVLLLVLATSLVGCGSSRSPEVEGAPTPAQPSDPNMLTAREIATVQAVSLYDAISKLRANFLTNRGRVTINTTGSSMPVVYRDGTFFGQLDALKSIQASEVEYVRMYRPSEFQGRFGSGNAGGVIEVISRKQ
jgi:hypothetical protein